MAMTTHRLQMELAAGTPEQEVLQIAIQSGKVTGNPFADLRVTGSRASERPGHRIFDIEYKTGTP